MERLGKRQMGALIDLVYPRRCVLCGQIPRLSSRKEEERLSFLGLCPQCFPERYRLTGKEWLDENMTWGRSCFRYEGRLADALSDLKYGGMKENGVFFARWMMLVPGMRDFVRSCDVITSVPVSAERLRQRSYNQAEVMAREVARLSGVPYEELLLRGRATKAMKNLGRQARRENLSGAFSLRPGIEPPEGTVLLVDDILTTGATVLECRASLGSSCRYLTFARDVLG